MEIWKDPKALQHYREASGVETLKSGFALIGFLHELAKTGVRNQNPEWTEAQVRAEMRRRVAEEMEEEQRQRYGTLPDRGGQ